MPQCQQDATEEKEQGSNCPSLDKDLTHLVTFRCSPAGVTPYRQQLRQRSTHQRQEESHHEGRYRITSFKQPEGMGNTKGQEQQKTAQGGHQRCRRAVGDDRWQTIATQPGLSLIHI